MILVRSVADSELAVEEHGLMLPLPGSAPDSIVLEERDGGSILRFHAKAIEAKTDGERKPFIKASDLRLRVFVTDARIAFACTKFDKGGGWFGGPTALAMNAGSKLLAAHRRKGKMFVGHMRYPWISDVYARNKDGWLSEEMLRIIVRLPGDESWTKIDLELPKESSATALASEIVRRAAAFRLGHEPDLDDDERAQFGELAGLADLVWTKGEDMVGVTFRTSWPVGEQSARFGPEGGMARQAGSEPAAGPDTRGASVTLTSLIGGGAATPAGAGTPASTETLEPPAPRALTGACGSCEAALSPGDRFCGRCGAPVGGDMGNA